MFHLEKPSRIGQAAVFIGGAGLGAALMYVLDPERGRRRRALARDKAVSFAKDTGRAVARTSRDLGNRAKGVAAEVRSAVAKREDSDGNGHDEATGSHRGASKSAPPRPPEPPGGI
jgi:hypothetical protein